MLNVSEIMSRNVLTLDVASSARAAAAKFTERGVSGAPVLDHGRAVGVLSKTDLVRAKNLDVPVAELMTPLVHWVRPDDPAQTAVDILIDERLHRVVVLGAGGEVVGMLTPGDVLRAERRAVLRYPSVWPHAEAAHAVPGEGDF